MSERKEITNNAGKVFVATYGSLRRGMHNFGVNQRGGGEYFGTGQTRENFNLYRYGGAYFPSVSLKHDSHGVPVVVDVFEAPETGLIGAYDGLEGHRGNDNPHTFYKRTQVVVDMPNNYFLKAWIYHIDEEQNEPVLTGDWCLHHNENYYKEMGE
ncbi:MAG: gamma-glutamylcyclotransferase family protein [Cetobacterium sp.]|uniref:gamma-glutamylcyclotransferase family protein n=1 Tax=Cetobacterium sp. TaxID=2071632 RepID=UPI003EE4EB05